MFLLSIDQFHSRPVLRYYQHLQCYDVKPDSRSSRQYQRLQIQRHDIFLAFQKHAPNNREQGLTSYRTRKDFQQDIKEGGGVAVETAKIGLDAAKNAEEYVVDNMIMDAGIAAAPETFGLSLLVAGAATIVHNLTVDSIVNVAKSTVIKIKHFFKKLF